MHKKRTAPLNQDWDMIDGVGVSISQFQKLLTALKESLNSIVLQMSAIQDQIDLLAVVVLQNRRGLDLLTAEKGRLCLFLGEDCCFFANKSDTVRDIIKNLKIGHNSYHPRNLLIFFPPYTHGSLHWQFLSSVFSGFHVSTKSY
jgi:hypothetical protein